MPAEAFPVFSTAIRFECQSFASCGLNDNFAMGGEHSAGLLVSFREFQTIATEARSGLFVLALDAFSAGAHPMKDRRNRPEINALREG